MNRFDIRSVGYAVSARALPRRRACAAMAAAVILAAWPLAAGGAEVALSKPVGEHGSPLRARWTSSLGGARAKTIFLPPPEIERRPLGAPVTWAPPELLFVITNDNRLGCIDRNSGYLRWMARLPGPIIGELPAITPGGVYFVANQRLVGLELLSGDTMFDVRLPFAPVGGMAAVSVGRAGYEAASGRSSAYPGVALRAIREDRNRLVDELDRRRVGDILYILGADNLLRRVEVVQKNWPPPHSMPFRNLDADLHTVRHEIEIAWTVPVQYPGLPAGAVMAGAGRADCFFVLLSSYNGNSAHMVGIDANRIEGAVPWSMLPYRFQRPVSAAPVVADSLMLVPSLEGSLYAISSINNRLMWKYSSGDALRSPPQFAGDPLEIPGRTPADRQNDEDGNYRPAPRAGHNIPSTVAEARRDVTAWRPDRQRSLVFQKLGASGPLAALRFQDGSEAWPSPIRGGRLVVAQMENPGMEPARRVFFVIHNDDGTLSGVRMSDGYELWRAAFSGGDVFAANARTQMAYTLVDDGSAVMALERVP